MPHAYHIWCPARAQRLHQHRKFYHRRTEGTCYDMATYPCIYVYDAPGINPAAFGSYGAGIYIPKLGLVPKHVRPVRPVANLYDLLTS